MGKRKNAGKKKNYNITKITILIIAIVAVLAVIFALYRNTSGESSVKIFSLPLIQTQTYSVNDGEMHDTKTNISFSVDKKLSKKYDEQEMLELTTQTISSLEYDELNQPYGTQYLKNEIYESICAQKPEIVNENFNVYVSGFDLGLVNGYLPGLIQEDTFDRKLQQIFGN